MVLRKCVYEVDMAELRVDARHLIRDTDTKLFETLARNFTRNNLNSLTRTFEHRIRTGFNMCFKNYNQDLSRFFRLKFTLDASYLSGADILSDLPWDDIVADEDLKSVVYNILSDLKGHDLPLHPIEQALKVIVKIVDICSPYFI